MQRKRILVLAALVTALLVEAGVVLAGAGPIRLSHGVPVQRTSPAPAKGSRKVIVGHAASHFRTGPLRSLRPVPLHFHAEHEASPNPLPASRARHARDTVVQDRLARPNMPSPSHNFDGIAYPGVNCNCVPPDTNGDVGTTQYVQIVNQGFQVFDKNTGASVFGPVDIATLWPSGTCRNLGQGDPVVLYDQLANRWVISQFAGNYPATPITDECIAVSTTSDATGSYNAYDFNLGTDFFDYPKLGAWPDAYYMSMNVFDSTGTDFLGPQPFAFDRAAMLAGNPSPTFVTSRDPTFFNPDSDSFMPADLDGSTPPPAGAPNPFLTTGIFQPTWSLYRFHVDFANPVNSTFNFAATVTPAPFTALCVNRIDCVPQLGSFDGLDALADRGMFRSAYRNFGGGHEALVGNLTVSSNGVAGIRWFEVNHVTSGAPTFVQQSTYQPDSTWRWMGSAAMDHNGDLALGFSASSAAINPKIGYAGRLVTDVPSQLLQGETTLVQGTGSQQASGNRWGDYSDMTVDPVDDCTFWYTQEYYSTTSQSNWRTRIGSFRFPSCSTSQPALSLTKSADAASVSAGSQMGFTVGLSNPSSAPATGITLTDPLPSGTGVNWSVDAPNSLPGWSIVGLPPSQTAVYSGTALASGASTHVHLVSSTSTSSCRAFPNTASYTADYGLSGQASASTTVTCAPPPVTCKVPKVLGLKLAKAKTKLRKAHCRAGKVRKKFSTRRKKGKVVAQKPKAGKRFKAGTKVALWIGKGPRRR
jgi:uncharacterized repeat protein (TIGR01451 family)